MIILLPGSQQKQSLPSLSPQLKQDYSYTLLLRTSGQNIHTDLVLFYTLNVYGNTDCSTLFYLVHIGF